MTHDPHRPPEFAVVPFVVGLRMEDAQVAARKAWVVLAQPDPDGPPLGELVWRRRVRVTSQDPPAGTVLRSLRSVVVTWSDEELGGDREPRRPRPPEDREQAAGPAGWE